MESQLYYSVPMDAISTNLWVLKNPRAIWHRPGAPFTNMD